MGCFALSLSSLSRLRCVASHRDLGREFSYKELRYATKNFSDKEKLGSGGFGSVYWGWLRSSGGIDTLVVVKRFNFDAEATFLAEISSLGQIRHENVVQLQGWCHERGERLLLVCDYMANGSLNEWLHDGFSPKPLLPWRIRRRVVEGVAAVVE